jgi:exopolysaccharide biosynthesis polyprenyl glycosylphosphotransferase
MSGAPSDIAYAGPAFELLGDALDPRTREILERRRTAGRARRRGWLVRRMLLAADLTGLVAGFSLAELLFGADASIGISNSVEWLMFLGTLPLWIVLAKLYGLYDRDEERTGYSTADDLVGVFHVVTVGAWVFYAGTWLTEVAKPDLMKVIAFWGFSIALVTLGRSAARGFCHRQLSHLQNTIIVGAGEVGQLVARKLQRHPEYGINVVGFVDRSPRERRADLGHLAMLGPPEELTTLVRLLDVERVIFAFAQESHAELLPLVRSLGDLEVQVDIVPRLFEVVGPSVGIHTVEGLPLVGLPPVRLSRSSRLLKRTVDLVGAALLLLASAALFAYIACRVKFESPGPVFFRQRRLGRDMKGFTALKFRTMIVDTDDRVHQEYIRNTMNAEAARSSNGLYKLDRSGEVTVFGRWLRKRSLDELPQLINVLRGEMSLVGPRPCIAYETEHFAPHHFERFAVLPGLTGLWQVTARAHSTFREALDMDVAYVRGWSLGLDLQLLCRTPLQMLRSSETV